MTTTAPASTDALHTPTTRCIACRYDVTAIGVEGRCPECGLPLSESRGARRAWTVRRIGLARWMLVALAVLAVACLLAFPLRLLSSAVEPYAGGGLIAAGRWAVALAQPLSILAAAILAWIVAHRRVGDAGRTHLIVPALVGGAVLSIIIAMGIGIALDFGDAVGAEKWGIWPFALMICITTCALAMMVLAPLVTARSMVMHGSFPTTLLGPLRLAILSVFVWLVAGVLTQLEFVVVTLQIQSPSDRLLAVIRGVVVGLAVVSFAAWAAILYAATHVRRATSARLAEIETMQKSLPAGPS